MTAWKVSQAALLTLKAESWEALGFQMQQVPSLYRLMVIEGKVLYVLTIKLFSRNASLCVNECVMYMQVQC